jgi:hypothetical protein
MTLWFGFKDGDVVALGEHENIDDVDDNNPLAPHCQWIWPEEDFRLLRDNINALLGECHKS